MAETPIDGITKFKPELVAFKLRQQIEAMRDAITADNTTVVDAITTAEEGADKAAIVASLATVKSDANTQAAARVAAIDVELAKLSAVLK